MAQQAKLALELDKVKDSLLSVSVKQVATFFDN